MTGVIKAKGISKLTNRRFDTLEASYVYNGAMIEGRCPRCGHCFVGWALRFPRNQMCSNCGAALEIYLDGKRISEGYSPFTAEEHSVNLPPGARSAPESVEKARQSEDKRSQS